MSKPLYVLSIVLLLGYADAQVSDTNIIEYLKNLPSSRLDSALPHGRFENWLNGIVGRRAKMQWEVNDCGEQTGVPAVDTVRDMPTCVEVSGQLADLRRLGISIIVGTVKQGLSQNPAIFDIYLGSGKTAQTFERLSDLEKALKRRPSK